MKTYAGVGSRRTPEERIGRRLAELGWTLRTGGAEGADQAFERGARAGGGAVEIFLPWPGFSGYKNGRLERPSVEAVRVASSLHPAWERLSPAAKKLIARNSHQVLGAGMDDPVAVVICWTPDGAETEAECGRETGGTGQAIRPASRLGVPVVNLKRPGALEG